MAENKPFVVNDRRKFTAEGELRPDAQLDPAPVDREPAATVAVETPRASSVAEFPEPEQETPTDSVDDRSERASDTEDSANFPPPPTAEESAQVSRAYESMVERLDTALRASNPGGERLPAMTFERLVQSLYMQSLLQLGGASEPGQQPQLDLIGARQTIDMLSIISDKADGNLSDAEDKLLQSALFELRMGFLEVTQALARQAASRQSGGGPGQFSPGGGVSGAPNFGSGGGPSIVR